jgi:hypothetical protein
MLLRRKESHHLLRTRTRTVVPGPVEQDDLIPGRQLRDIRYSVMRLMVPPCPWRRDPSKTITIRAPVPRPIPGASRIPFERGKVAGRPPAN